MRDDLISRQALLEEYDRLHVGEPGRARKMIEDAPSVQPEKRTEERTETHACDLISRQAAIDALKNQMSDRNDLYNIPVRRSIVILEQLPSAQPERKPGHWEIYIISMLDGEGCRCSECGFEGAPYWDFCPNCGADMRGE